MKITVVIGRCNDKETHYTNGSIYSVSDSKEEATDNKYVRKELEVPGNCKRPWSDRRGLERQVKKKKATPRKKTKEGDNDNQSNTFDELEVNQFDWHTTEGLLEGVSSHYNKDDHITKNTTEQIDLLLKKYSLAQLKLILSCVYTAIDVDQRDRRVKYINLKPAAGDKLNEMILPLIDSNDFPEVLTLEEGTIVDYQEGGDTYIKGIVSEVH